MKAFIALVVLAGFLLAGCSGAAPQELQPDSQGRYVVHMTAGGNKFLPASASVPTGATVAWKNDGATPHNVIADDGSFDSGPRLVGQGEEFTHTFNEPGTFSYQCHLHAGMKGKITVTGDAVGNGAETSSGSSTSSDLTGTATNTTTST